MTALVGADLVRRLDETMNISTVNKLQNRSIYQVFAETDHWKETIQKRKQE